MSEFWQQLLLQIAVSFLGGLLGGGMISAYLDWRRFRREQAEIEREEQRFAVDSIRSLIFVTRWTVDKQMSDKLDDKLELYVYRHKLQGSVQEYAIVAEFFIKNLTDDEVIVTRIEVEEPELPPFDYWEPETDDAHVLRYSPSGDPFIQLKGADFQMYDMEALFEWKTKDLVRIENVTLSPKGNLPIAYVVVRRFCAIRELAAPPKSIAVTVHSTGGHKVTQRLELTVTKDRNMRSPKRVDGYTWPKGSIESDIVGEEEEEIPF